jgi:hypothetical protein
MSMFRPSRIAGRRREWILPVLLFFVAMFAIARTVLEAQRGPATHTLIHPLGFLPMLFLLAGTAGLGVAWYFQGRIDHPLRKVLALVLIALPLAAFLAYLQSPGGAYQAGGRMGALLALPFGKLPAVLGTGLLTLLLGFSAWLAFRLAFLAEPASSSGPRVEAVPTVIAGRDARPTEDALDLEPDAARGGDEGVWPSAGAAEPQEAPAAVEPALEPEEAGVAAEGLPPHLLPAGEAAGVDLEASMEPSDPALEFDEFREPEPTPILAGLAAEDDEDPTSSSPAVALAPEEGTAESPRWEALERLERALEARRSAAEPGTDPEEDLEEEAEPRGVRAGDLDRTSPGEPGMEEDSEQEDTAELPRTRFDQGGSRLPDSRSPVEDDLEDPGLEEAGPFAEGPVWAREDEDPAAPEEPASPHVWAMEEPVEPTVILPRLSGLEAEPSPAAPVSIRSGPAEDAAPPRRSRPAAEADWASWEEPAPRRRPRPAAPVRAEDQPLLFETEFDDSTYRRAVDAVLSEERCSVAMLQRRFPLSWAQAHAMIERMHQEGLVGPPLPSGRRDVLGGPRRPAEMDVHEA